MSPRSPIASETALLAAGQMAGLALNFAGTIVLTRALGPEGRGVYAWVLTLVGLAIQVAALATAPALRALDQATRAAIAPSLPWLAAFGACLTAPLLGYAMLEGTIGREAGRLALLAWIAVPVTATALAFSTLVQIGGRATPILAILVAPRLIQLVLVLGLLGLGRLDVEAAIGLFVATACVELVLAAVLLPHRLLPGRPDLVALRRLVGHLGAGWVAGLALFGIGRIGLLVLGASAPLGRTGVYSAALTLQEVGLVAPFALGAVLISRGGMAERKGLRTKAAILAATAIGCGLAALVAPILVSSLFGAPFGEAAGPFRLLLLGIVCATVHQLCQPALFASGSGAAVAVPAFGGLVVATAVAVVAVPDWGIAGAVASNILGYATLAGLALWLAGRHSSVPRTAARRAAPT